MMFSAIKPAMAAATFFLAAAAASPALAATASLPLGAVLAVPNPNLRTVKIAIDSANGVEAALFRVQYNRSIAVATQVRKTTLTNACAIEVNTANPNNEVQISMACTNPLNGTGALFEIDFAGVNPGLSNLTFLECHLNEGSPSCQVTNGSIRVTTCALDVDGNGSAAANTDGVYIFRALPTALQTIVPPAFRQLIPGIPLDPVILDNVNTVLNLLNVDGKAPTQASTDGVYIFRSLSNLQTVVPPLFRQLDPTIPSDQAIGANVDALCP